MLFSLFKRDHKIHISTFHIPCKDDKHTIKNLKLVRISRKMFGAHLADGLPLTLQIATMLGVQFPFSESIQPYEYKRSIKKIFHCLVSELPATLPGQFSPSRLNWLCYLARIFYAPFSWISKKKFLESFKHTCSSCEYLIHWRNTFI